MEMAKTRVDSDRKEDLKDFLGVSLRFLSDFAAKVPADLTTAQIAAEFIAPRCNGQPFVDIVSPKYVGPAQHYIIHSWSCCFLSDLVVPLLQHFIGDPNADIVGRSNALSNTFIWIDCFSIPLHSPETPAAAAAAAVAASEEGGGGSQGNGDDMCTVAAAASDPDGGPLGRPRRQPDTFARRSVVDDVLLQCNSAVLLLDSGATALTRTWCLYEVVQALTLRGPQFLHIPVFDFTMDIVYSSLRSVNLHTSEARNLGEQRELLSALALQFKEEADREDAGGGGGNPLRRSARLSGALGAATRRIISGIQDALVSEAQQLIRAGVRSGPRYLACLRKAAEALRLGKAPLAEALALAAVKEHRKALGDSDATTLTSLSNLALLRRSQGKSVEAEELLRQVLAGRQSTLGRDHPDTAASCDQLAWLLQDSGKLEAAAALYREALDISQRALGEDHPDTASSCNNLAGVLQSLGRLDEAEPLLKRSLEGTKRTLGERHPHTATNYNNLGVLYRSRGDVRTARENFEAAYQITVGVLGWEHADTATATSNLGLAMLAEGRLKESEELLRQGLEGSEPFLGSSHPSVRQMLAALASVLKEQGRTEEAEEVFYRAVTEPPSSRRGRLSESPKSPHVTPTVGVAAAEEVAAASAAAGAENASTAEPLPPPSPPRVAAASGREPRRAITIPIYTPPSPSPPGPHGPQPSGVATDLQEPEPLSPGGMVGDWVRTVGTNDGTPNSTLPSPRPEPLQPPALSPPPSSHQQKQHLKQKGHFPFLEVTPEVQAAVLTIQSHHRAYLARQHVTKIPKEAGPVMLQLQATEEFKGSPCSGSGQMEKQQRTAAAVRIQAYHRGHVARRKVAAMLREAAGSEAVEVKAAATTNGPRPPVAAAMAGLAAAAATLPPLTLPATPSSSPLLESGAVTAAATAPPPTLSSLPLPATPSLPPTPTTSPGPTRRPLSRNAAIVNAREALRRSAASGYGAGANMALSSPPPPPTPQSYSYPGFTSAAGVPGAVGKPAHEIASHAGDNPSREPSTGNAWMLRAADTAAARNTAILSSITGSGGGDGGGHGNGGSVAVHNLSRGTSSSLLPPSCSPHSALLSESVASLESGGLQLLPSAWVAATAVPVLTPRVDDLVELHADLLGGALRQLRLSKARDNVLKSGLESRAALEVKLELIRSAVEQAVIAIGDPRTLLTPPTTSCATVELAPVPSPPQRNGGSDVTTPSAQEILQLAAVNSRWRSSGSGNGDDGGFASATPMGATAAAVASASRISNDSGKDADIAVLPPTVGSGGGLHSTRSRNSSNSSSGGGDAATASPLVSRRLCGVPPPPPDYPTPNTGARPSLTQSSPATLSATPSPSPSPSPSSLSPPQNSDPKSGALPSGAPGERSDRQSVREGELQTLMSELVDLRALLYTTSSALSAAQRGLNQERVFRKAMSAEIGELQRRLSAAMGLPPSASSPQSPQQQRPTGLTVTATTAARPPSARAPGTALSPTAPAPGPFAATVNAGGGGGGGGSSGGSAGGCVVGSRTSSQASSYGPPSALRQPPLERYHVVAATAVTPRPSGIC